MNLLGIKAAETINVSNIINHSAKHLKSKTKEGDFKNKVKDKEQEYNIRSGTKHMERQPNMGTLTVHEQRSKLDKILNKTIRQCSQ